jgi:hypothetical protein
MKIQAIYYHEDYNAFKEFNKGKPPYEIEVDIPNNLSLEQVKEEAKKPSALKDGYSLHELNMKLWNGFIWKYINIKL